MISSRIIILFLLYYFNLIIVIIIYENVKSSLIRQFPIKFSVFKCLSSGMEM